MIGKWEEDVALILEGRGKQVVFLQKILSNFVKYRKNQRKLKEVEKNSCRFSRIVVQYKVEKFLTDLSV